jgi:hypothetical protein
MKTILNVLDPEGQRYYHYNGGKVYLPIVKNKILITLNKPLSKSELKNTLKSLDNSSGFINQEKSIENLKDASEDIYILADLFDTTDIKLPIKIDLSFQNDNIAAISEVFQMDGKVLSGLTNQIIIKLKQKHTIAELEGFFLKYGIAEYESSDFNTCLLTLKDLNEYDALEVAIMLNEENSEVIEFADPNFFRSIPWSSFVPNDPLLGSQWNLNALGMEEAWCWNSGINMEIGIMDSGILTTHPDLADNFIGSYDPTGHALGSDSHGTLCTGCAVAVADNWIGLAGVAFGALFHDIRRGYNPSSNPDYPFLNTNDAWFAGCFNYALANVKIVSCSFGWGNPSATTDNAVHNFITVGRYYRGGLLFAASGNFAAEEMGYPASYAGAFAVGASDQFGGKASFSNYGLKLDFLAPGVDITTTAANGGYSGFTGTSAACPIAAACAALVIREYPDLTIEELREKLSRSCVHPQFGVNTIYGPYGVRNDTVGYGVLNMKNFWDNETRISSPRYFCGTTLALTTYGTNSSQTTWTSSNANLPISLGQISNPLSAIDRTVITAVVNNLCAAPKTAVVVAGPMPEEAYVLVWDLLDYYKVRWVPGNSSTYNIKISNNNSNLLNPQLLKVGWAPLINKSTLFPPVTANAIDEGWETIPQLFYVDIISHPAGWYNIINQFHNQITFNTSDNAGGTLVLGFQTPCGPLEVTFNVIGF